jgi:hypothetical protein
MSDLLSPQNQWTRLDRDTNNFRESPQHGNNYPARAVIVENDQTDPIPVQVVDGEPGTPTHFTSGELNTTGLLQTLISQTVPASTEYDLYLATVICRAHGKFTVKLNGSLIGSGRTGPSLGSLSSFKWSPRYVAVAGDQIQIQFKADRGSPINEVEAYLQVSTRSV